MLVAIWVGMIILGPFTFRFWSLTLVGLILPYLLGWSYFYINDEVSWFFGTIEHNFNINNPLINLNIAEYVLFLFLFLIIVLASIQIINELRTSKISSRKYMRIFSGIFITLLLLFLFVPSTSIEIMPVVAIPVSFLLSYYFIAMRNHWLGNILIVVFLFLMLGVQLFPVIFKLAI
jgi:hypothetical protein